MSSTTDPNEMLRKMLTLALSTSIDGEALAALNRARSQLATRKLSPSDLTIGTGKANGGFDAFDLARERMSRMIAETEASRLRDTLRNRDAEIARLQAQIAAKPSTKPNGAAKPTRSGGSRRTMSASIELVLIRRMRDGGYLETSEVREITGWTDRNVNNNALRAAMTRLGAKHGYELTCVKGRRALRWRFV